MCGAVGGVPRGEAEKARILSCRRSLLALGMERAHLTDYLICVYQKISDSIKITFLVKVKTTVKSDISLGLLTWALAQVIPFWARVFSLTVPLILIFFKKQLSQK